MEVEIVFGTLKKCPRPSYMSVFPGPEEVSLNGGVPLIEVSQCRGSTARTTSNEKLEFNRKPTIARINIQGTSSNIIQKRWVSQRYTRES